MKKSLCLLVFLTPLTTLSGCIQVAGRWEGAIVESGTTEGTATVVVSQNLWMIQGTWVVDFPGSSSDNSGTFIGRISPTRQASIILTPSNPLSSCSFRLDGVFTSQDFDGIYVAIGCPVTQNGTVHLEKQ